VATSVTATRRRDARREHRIRLLDVELSRPLTDIEGLDGYHLARLLVRAHGTPVGSVDVEVRDGGCTAGAIRAAIVEQLHPEPQSLIGPAGEPFGGPWPSLTVAVCTRGRPDDLAECLKYLDRLDYPDLEILIVDNAPDDDANAEVCRGWPRVRYVVEPRPGLDWARNRAVLEATGEILAFTDDDVRVDPDWAREIVVPFVTDPGVGAVAGLGVPLELETPAQLLFEEYGGASGGYTRIRMQGGPEWGVRGMWHYGLMAPHGSGANMAFRRSVFDTVGLFDPALGVGTVTNGGDDTEMLFRVLAHGYGMVYEPRAVIRHRHRREYAGVERQIAGWGSGMYAFLTRSVLTFPRAWWVIGLLGARSLGHLVQRVLRPGPLPRTLVLKELRGALGGPLRYFRARSGAREIERRFGPQSSERAP
jgi:O-antigen biosynthesis protein